MSDKYKIHIPNGERAEVAAWLLAVADCPCQVATSDVGFVIPVELWDKPVAGKTVGEHLAARADHGLPPVTEPEPGPTEPGPAESAPAAPSAKTASRRKSD